MYSSMLVHQFCIYFTTIHKILRELEIDFIYYKTMITKTFSIERIVYRDRISFFNMESGVVFQSYVEKSSGTCIVCY